MPRIVVTRNSAAEISKTLMKIVQKKFALKLDKVIQRAADREIGKFMRFIASQTVSNDNFKVLQPYLPAGKPWRDYAPSYQVRKQKEKGFQNWFYFDGGLYQDFQEDTPTAVIAAVGKTQVLQITPQGLIRIRVAPNLKLSLNNMEDQLYLTDLIDESTLRKLKNRKNRYRALIGPVLYYFLDQRVTQAIVADLRKEARK